MSDTQADPSRSPQEELQELREEIRQLRIDNNHLQQRLYEVHRRLDEVSNVVGRVPPRGAPETPRQGTWPTTPPLVPPPLPIPPAAETAASTTAAEEPPEIATAPLEAPPVGEPPRLPLSEPVASGALALQQSVPRESFEVRLGTYWLPRIGMAALLTGMVFFAAYITPRLSVPQKVGVGYLTCVVLGALGLWLEKKMPQFARVLQAGSLALTYFVTYAAHFVESFRVIHSPALALTFLSVVVVAIVGVAQERQSATLAGMALFFGYYTSVASGVTGFTLASNAVLALAALFFLARNRWVHISYGAVLATYLTYMIWVWKLNRFGDLERLVFGSAYLGESDFRLRAAFLALYWLLFTAGGLIVRREVLPAVERNGLLSLNNAFFFVLFTLLMHHAHPDRQWTYQFCFGGALLVSSAIAFGRFQPERLVMDTLFVQGLGVATLGLISYLKDVKLVAALALESAFVLVLAQAMKSRWVAWIGRATFGVAAAYAWGKYPHDWDAPMIWGVAFAAAVGLVCARLERTRAEEDRPQPIAASPLYFAVLSTVLAMLAAGEHFARERLPWVWVVLAAAIAVIGGALRTKEIFWASQLPLAWAHASFYLAKLDDNPWPVGQSVALVLVTLGFGAVLWFRRRGTRRRIATEEAAATGSDPALAGLPYLAAAVAAIILMTFDHCPARWRLATFGAEMLALMIAGVWLAEVAFAWAALATMAAGAAGYVLRSRHAAELGGVGWANLLIGLLLLVLSERTLKWLGDRLASTESERRGLRAVITGFVTALAIVAVARLVDRSYLTVDWAVCGFLLLALGFWVKERPYRIGGLVTLGFSLARAALYDLSRLEVVYRILSFIGLGVILLVLAFLYTRNRDKIARWL